MQLTQDQVDALEHLGTELETAGWSPEHPLAEGFEMPGPEPRRRRLRLALAFLRQHDERIRAAICVGEAVKPEVLAATSIASAVADGLQAAGGLPIPAWTVANTLCQFGLGRYCALGPKPG